MWAPCCRIVDGSFVALDDVDVIVDHVNTKEHSLFPIGDQTLQQRERVEKVYTRKIHRRSKKENKDTTKKKQRQNNNKKESTHPHNAL